MPVSLLNYAHERGAFQSGFMKRAANLSVDAALLEDARALDINPSQAPETGLRRAAAGVATRKWRLRR